jgi:hypothetical protein
VRGTWVGILGGGLVVLGIVAMIAGTAVHFAGRESATVVVAGPAGVAQPLGPGATGGDVDRDGATGDDEMGPGMMGGGQGPGVRGGDPFASPPGSVTVSFDGSAFVPMMVAVRAGGSVTWRNDDTRIHSVAAADGSWSSGDLLPGATFSQTFTTPGRFPFSSPDHPRLRGVVFAEP